MRGKYDSLVGRNIRLMYCCSAWLGQVQCRDGHRAEPEERGRLTPDNHYQLTARALIVGHTLQQQPLRLISPCEPLEFLYTFRCMRTDTGGH